jgi:hypothetical protein
VADRCSSQYETNKASVEKMKSSIKKQNRTLKMAAAEKKDRNPTAQLFVKTASKSMGDRCFEKKNKKILYIRQRSSNRSDF